jgi:hypothetical protein
MSFRWHCQAARPQQRNSLCRIDRLVVLGGDLGDVKLREGLPVARLSAVMLLAVHLEDGQLGSLHRPPQLHNCESVSLR